ncbi:MAG: hypothetical protein BWZ07_02765 [Alphaproteobacteria bacterium ADurb.BinA280]|nr:MAG: hypothetical protein BWZ07_02765 [Alphaproteobacteria bacterium ADurb.BinA280]
MLSIGTDLRCRHLEVAAGVLLGLALAFARVEVRVTILFGEIPQRAVVRQPAEFVEAPVDPGRISESVAQLQTLVRLHFDNPTILVVHRAQHHRRAAAVTGELDGIDAQRTRTLQRGLVSLLAQICQRIDSDARQHSKIQCFDAATLQVDAKQLLRNRQIAPHAHADFLAVFVTTLGHVGRHFAQSTAVGLGIFGDRQQPATVGRQHRADQFHITQEYFRRQAMRRLLCQGGIAFRSSVAPGFFARQGADQTQLQGGQIVRLGFLWIGRGAQACGRRDQSRGKFEREPVGTHPKHHPAISHEAWLRLLGLATGELAQCAVVQCAQEQVAVLHHQSAAALGIEDRLRTVECRQFGVLDRLCSRVRACDLNACDLKQTALR